MLLSLDISSLEKLFSQYKRSFHEAIERRLTFSDSDGMRHPRAAVPHQMQAARYHCHSRVVEKRFHFRDAEKTQFVKILREYEKSCGVRILTYCILSNHFHLLIEVPRRPEKLPEDSDLFEMNSGLTGGAGKAAQLFRETLLKHRARGESEPAELLKAKWCRRMWDLGTFMKLLKQRFSSWFNRTHNREGTLWEDRYRSHLVGGEVRSTAMVAAYIDLNPIRAGIVKCPHHYKFSGFSEAVAGADTARKNLHPIASSILRRAETELTDQEVLDAYKDVLGSRFEKLARKHSEERRELLRKIQNKVLLPASEFLKLRVRYFNGGIAFGSKEFVESIFMHNRGFFSPKRKTGARKIKGLAGEPLYTLRDLRRNVFS